MEGCNVGKLLFSFITLAGTSNSIAINKKPIFVTIKHYNVSTFQHYNNKTMSAKKLLILNSQQIQQKIDRIAYQVLEDNFDEGEVMIAGILPRGNLVAQRIKTILDKIAPFKTRLLTIQLDKESSTLKATTDFDVQDCKDKVVIIVDDVLNSGKTLAYGIGVFLNVPLKKIRSVVLVDRNHKSFPVTTDYAGMALSTIIKEHIDVVLDKATEADAVYLV